MVRRQRAPRTGARPGRRITGSRLPTMVNEDDQPFAPAEIRRFQETCEFREEEI